MSKRGNNEGSVYKRQSDGRWVGQITIDGRKRSKYCKSQREARDWIKVMQKQIDQGLTLAAVNLLLGDYLDTWIKTEHMRLKPKTHHHYSQVIRDHINPFLGKIKLSELTPLKVQKLYNKKIEEGNSERMVILIHAVLHHALNDALKQGIIGRNPADAVTHPRYIRKEFQTWDANQAMVFLSHAKGTRYETFFYIAIITGMRSGELLGLQWKDVDWTNNRLNIRRQMQRITGKGLVLVEPKSRAGKRAIKLGNQAVEMLRKQDLQLELEKAIAGKRWEDHDLIFPNSLGKPGEHGNIYRIFKELTHQAALPDIHFHDLRHTAATLMLQEGTHPKIVQERLGHSQISLTLDTYSHVLPSMQDEVAEKMDELLTPTTIEVKSPEPSKRIGME